MSKLDQEYKKRFAEKKFPDSLKERGWKDMQQKLDAEMPVKPAPSVTKWWAGLAGLAVLILAVWLTTGTGDQSADENLSPAAEQPGEKAGQETPSINYSTEITEESLTTESEYPENRSAQKMNDADKAGTQEAPERSGNTVNHHTQRLTTPEGQVVVLQEPKTEGISETSPKSDDPLPQESVTSSIVSTQQKNIPSENAESVSDNETVRLNETASTEASPATENYSQDVSGEVKEREIPPAMPATAANDEANILRPDTTATIEVKVSAEVETVAKSGEMAIPHLSFMRAPAAEEKAEEKLILPLGASQRFSLSFVAASYYSDKILKGDGPNLQSRKEQESGVWKWSSGFLLNYYFDRNWTLSFGPMIADYGEQLDYSSPLRTDTARVDGRYASPREFPNILQIDSVRIIDSINVGHWDYFVYYQRKLNDTLDEVSGSTYWRYLEIPLLLGYRPGEGRVRPWFRTGPVIGIPLQKDFRYLSSEDEYSLMTESYTDAYTPPLLFSWELQMGVDISLHPKWSFGMSALGSLNLNPIYRDEVIEQRYYRLGVNAGLSYHF